jgi:hypothetical protein
MEQTVPGIFNRLDGWTSHSYPNHGFVGRPDHQGRASVFGYRWELDQLKQIGLNNKLPVYITETGWPHREGLSTDSKLYRAEQTADYFQTAFSNWEKDDWVQAVTPFVLNYPEVPFDHFSWLDREGKAYPQFERVVSLTKPKGQPEQEENYALDTNQIVELLPTDYTFTGQVTLINTGQSILGERGLFRLPITAPPEVKITIAPLPEETRLLPGQQIALPVNITTTNQPTEADVILGNRPLNILVYRPWSLSNQKVNLWQQFRSQLTLWWLNISRK